MSGQILGDRYEIERQLGKKSGRWTLLARDLMTGNSVVLKVIFLDENLGPDDLTLFKREMEALQTVKHPATPQYLGYFEMALPRDGKAMALIQSHLEGISLEKYLRERQSLTEAETKNLAQSILEILSYLHEHQPPIIHRDIKPSNILLSSAPVRVGSGRGHSTTSQACLVDFGSVKSLASTDATTFAVVGTDGYMSPEQLGKRAVRTSDLYSLGVTLLTAVSGIASHNLPRRGFRIQVEQIPGLSPSLRQWLTKMSEPDLGQRFPSARAALQALETIG